MRKENSSLHIFKNNIGQEIRKIFDKHKNKDITISEKEIVSICKHLSILISSGIRIDRALRMVKSRYKKKSLVKVLTQIEKNIIGGDSLFNSFRKSDGKFPNLLMEILEVSEITGELDVCLRYISDHFKEKENYKKEILMSLLYPIILIIVIIIVFIILIVFVIPDFILMFKESDIEPPMITNFIFSISQFINNNSLILSLSIIIVIISTYYLYKKDKYKNKVNRFLFKIPILRNIIININTVQFTKSIHIMFSSGIGLCQAINISYQNTKNPIYKNEYKKIVKSLNEGSSLSRSIEHLDIFPEIFKMLIFVGEESGELEESFKLSYEFTYQELSNSLNRMLKLSEPILIIVVALMVVGIIFSVFLPIMNIYESF